MASNPSGKRVWKVDVQVGVKPNGRPRFVRRTAPTKSAALRLGQQIMADAANGALAPQGRELFHSFALRWLYDTKAPQVREATTHDYRYKLETYILPTFGKRPIAQINTNDVTGWLKELHCSGKSNFTINGVRQVLNAVMRAALSNGYIVRNPVTNTPVYRRTRRDMVNVKEPWSLSEAQQVLAAVRNSPVELFTVLLVYFGLRKSEALGLKWSDFDFDSGTFTINRSIREVQTFRPDGSRRTVVVEGDTKTLSSRRTLVLSPRVVEAILRHRDNIDHPVLRDGAAWVFSTKHGTVQRPGTVQRMLHRVLEAHNIRRIRIHDIRHTAVVLAIESGTPIEAVSQGAGHTRLDTTKSIYAPYSQTLANTFSNNVANYLSVNPIDDQLQELLTQGAILPPAANGGGVKP